MIEDPYCGGDGGHRPPLQGMRPRPDRLKKTAPPPDVSQVSEACTISGSRARVQNPMRAATPSVIVSLFMLDVLSEDQSWKR